jgi:UDP-N-acetyl-D-mannosaminuronic acid dehydrogenase
VPEVDVVVMGLGRVGLPTAALLARAGARVLGVDRDPAARERIAAGDGGVEPGLTATLREVLASGRFRVSARVEPAAAFVVCVPTPLRDGAADLEALDDAIEAIGSVLPPRATVVLESTVPVGTTDVIGHRLRKIRADVAVAYCPERVWPGDALREIATNDRIVGGIDRESTIAAEEVLRRFVGGRLDRTDARTAELVKLVENASRDVALAFAHTVARVAERSGLDPVEVRTLANRHPRVSLLEPGIGVGGHCLPVDPWFLVSAAPEDTALLRAAREANDAVPARIAERLLSEIPSDASVALLGLAYKPDVDDLRNAPAIAIALAIAKRRDVVVCDPLVDAAAVDRLGLRCATLEEALARSVLVLLVPHRLFASVSRRLRPDQRWIDPTGASR